MTLKEMKKKVLSLIEELNPNSELLTDDPDISAKMNHVISQIQTELARVKKVLATSTEEVTSEEAFDLNTLDQFYQLKTLRFVNATGEECGYEVMDNLILFEEDGTAAFFYYKYPETIQENTKDSHELEISLDALEIMPYGVAADLLKSDVSTNYGKIYADRYESMLQRLDMRYAAGGNIAVEGGVDI